MLLVFCILICGLSAPRKIDKMPLYEGPKLDVEQWAGYVDIPISDETSDDDYFHHLFYVLVKNPNASAPLLIWLDGGPGCSSLGGGYIREHGPYVVNPTETGIRVDKREYGWSNFAHILYIDSPVGTGFSYSDKRSDYSKNLNDGNTAADLLAFLPKFFQEFPDLKNNRIFVTGESYAGHFVPQLTNVAMLYTNYNIQGYIIGNGVTDYKYMVNTLPKYLTNHFLVTKEEYDDAYAKCKGDFWTHFIDPNCSLALGTLTSILYDGTLNQLDIYADCEVNGVQPLTCTDASPVETYVNSPEFLNAFGLDLKNTLTQKNFILCLTLQKEFVYSQADKAVSQIPLHLNLTKSVPLLFYSGDADTVVNNLATEMIMEILMDGKQRVDDGLWYYSTDNVRGQGIKQVGGMKKIYGNVHYYTVRGGGHQVPVKRGNQIYNLIKDFVLM